VQPEHGAEVHLRQHVAVEHDHRLGQRIPGVADRAAGAERHGFHDVADAQAEPLALAEDLLDAPRLVVQAEDDLIDFGHLPQQVDLVIQERPPQDRDDGLRRVHRQRPQPRALPAGEEDGLHSS
jgi:hypothetical protein